jgi:hypothetical protein
MGRKQTNALGNSESNIEAVALKSSTAVTPFSTDTQLHDQCLARLANLMCPRNAVTSDLTPVKCRGIPSPFCNGNSTPKTKGK